MASHGTADTVLRAVHLTQALQMLFIWANAQGDNVMDPYYAQEPTSASHPSIVMCGVPTRDFQEMTCQKPFFFAYEIKNKLSVMGQNPF